MPNANVLIKQSDLEKIKLNDGSDLLAISRNQAVLIVFLRHLGCTFCHEAMRDISRQREAITDKGHQIILVHMEDNAVAERFLKKYDLQDLYHLSDPNQHLYQQFGLVRGSFSQLFGFKTMIRGFALGFTVDQLGASKFGDSFQMPGVFVIRDGEIKNHYIHKTISDRPNYEELLQSCGSTDDEIS